MRVLLDGAGPPGPGRWRAQGHVPRAAPGPCSHTHTHTHTLELRHINACLFFHCDSRGDQERTQHTGEPEWVSTQMSPLSRKGKPHSWGC